MKKIIVGFLALTMLLSGASAFASGWNNIPADCPIPLAIGNYTTGNGIRNGPNGCWTLSNVSASSGQVINLNVFYDNTNGVDANNTVIHLTQSPSGTITTSSSTYTFSGNLTSSVGNLNFSTVTANLSSSQSLVYARAKMYSRGSSTGTAVSGFDAFGSGLNLGTVTKGDWGNIVFSFDVGTNGTTQTCTDPTATNVGGPLPCTYPNQLCTISNFTANGSSTAYIQSGDVVNLVWNTLNCTSATVSGPNGVINSNLSNNMPVYPVTSGTYTLVATGSNGATQTRTVYVNVGTTQNNCYINNFTGNGSTSPHVSSGNSVNFIWNTTGCTSVEVSGPSLYSTTMNSSQTIYPSHSGNYTLTAYGNNGGIQTRTVYVTVDDYYPTNNNCYINNFTANGYSNVTIQSGNPVSLVWNTTGCTSVNVSGPGIASNLFSGIQTVYPTNNGIYTVTAYSYNGTAPSRTVYVTVNPIIIQPPVYVNTCAVTTVVTNVGQNSAVLNGLVTGSNGNSYFEYGTTASLGYQTNPRMGNGSFSESVTGLVPNTVYYFRLVSQCNGALSYGKTEIFQTFSVKTVQPIIVQGTTVIGTQSPIMLKIEDRYQYIGVGDTVDYTVTYKNIGKSKLTKPVLQVVVPKGIILTNSSAGTYQTDTNTLTVQLMDLNPGDEGVVYLQGVVNSIDSTTAQIVTTAILVYTSPNGAQENAIAYVLNTPRGLVNNLGASAFWAGLANIGLVGWLLILILILLIVLLARRYSGNKVVHTTNPSGSHTTTTTNY